MYKRQRKRYVVEANSLALSVCSRWSHPPPPKWEALAIHAKFPVSPEDVYKRQVQAWMRVPIKLTNIDTLSVSGHKIHAPKGIGALYLSDRLVQAVSYTHLKRQL